MDKENCNICHVANRSPLVTCAVCKYAYHMKCISPKSTIKDFDALLSIPGFYFYCKDHHNLSVHKLLKRIDYIEDKFKKCFAEVNEELNDFQKSLKNCGLDNRMNESRSKSSNSSTQSIHVPSSFTVNARTNAVKRKNKEDISDEGPKRCKDSSVNLTTTNPPSASSSTTTSNPDPIAVASVHYSTLLTPSTSHRTSSSNVPNFSDALETELNSDISNQLENNLFALPQSRRVFLSHLPAETTNKAIENHLCKMMISTDQVSIEKFKFRQPRKYSSFVINVEDEDMYRHLLNPSNWPFGTIVHQYNSRPDFQSSQRRRMW